MNLDRLTWQAVVVVLALVTLTGWGFYLDHSTVTVVLGALGAVGTLAVHSVRTPREGDSPIPPAP